MNENSEDLKGKETVKTIKKILKSLKIKVSENSFKLEDHNYKTTLQIKGFYQYEDNDKTETKSFAKSAPIGIKLSDYLFIETVSSHYKVIDDNGIFNPNWRSTSNGTIEGMYFRTDRFKLIKEDFSSGYDYYAVFIIRDLANNIYYTKPVKIK